MGLDVWIYGPGYGESILMAWDALPNKEGTARRTAFIDCHGGIDFDEHPAIVQWGKMGCPDVAWVAITHPHMDHIRNASTMMAVAGCNAETLLWWGGVTMERLEAFYSKLGEDVALREERLGRLAVMTSRFIKDLNQLQRRRHGHRTEAHPPMILAPSEIIDAVCEEETPDGRLTISTISPWLEPQKVYTGWVDEQIQRDRDGHPIIFPKRGAFNSTSLGMVVQHGNAQVLLGGDMEENNWDNLHRARTSAHPENRHRGKLTTFKPCLIKVSHHGSETGHIPEMWGPGTGFFGSLKTGSKPPICIITPWRNAGRRLPDKDLVTRIAKAGCEVWETATKDEATAVDDTTTLPDSFIHLRVNAETNEAKMIEQRFCRRTPSSNLFVS
ncbi:MAG TPA: hypothetical protein VGF13_02325 [Verrucomicrobiae bacterium]|jgi:hypothetical protein